MIIELIRFVTSEQKNTLAFRVKNMFFSNLGSRIGRVLSFEIVKNWLWVKHRTFIIQKNCGRWVTNCIYMYMYMNVHLNLKKIEVKICEYGNTKFFLFNVRCLLSINSSYIWYFLKATNDLPLCLFQLLIKQIF